MLATLISTAVNIAGEVAGHEEPAPLIAPPFVIGGTIFAIFLVLMFVTVSYTNLGRRHEAVDEHADPHRQHPNKHDRGQGH
ncbi:hypothetical protein GCM10012320_08510 [Sinomonas cellulolyticus]|uniref:4-hydroxybenzoate polyprenyltransferase n=1 Tax=Sinomonas cellulolyticus TaxID=2801916 RepID=A0ABS1K3P4_9MICC|nr:MULTISPECIES: hypothetical protein [Sinomonas]MBL0706311.1 hypothetical protein [Sinomonas cellulolyticus]GHG44002.1 hypothetical protein GCM10012320_08510 [Sinomonas sp. KCTC 49339]